MGMEWPSQGMIAYVPGMQSRSEKLALILHPEIPSRKGWDQAGLG